METLITLIALGALANLVAYLFEPLQKLKDALHMYKWLPYAYCSKCVGLWLSIAVLWFLDYSLIQVILYSSLASVIAYFINQEIAKHEEV
jgi:hypothetical protein